MTLSLDERAKALGLHTYDTALPQEWVDEVVAYLKTSINFTKWTPVGDVVWCYDHNSWSGYPVPLSAEAARCLQVFSAHQGELRGLRA